MDDETARTLKHNFEVYTDPDYRTEAGDSYNRDH